jgi:hypothetical protein
VFFLQVPEEADADWIVAPRADVSVASTKKIRAESSSFEDVEANGGVQPLTKKTAAADTERIVAVPDSIDEEIHEPDANN